MRKFMLFFVSILSVVMFSVSCDDDDDNNVPPAPSLVGTWIYSKEGTIVDGTEVLIDYQHTAGCAKDQTTFSSTGVITDVYYDSTDTPCEQFTDEGTYTVSGSTITVNVDGINVTGEIVTLTATELKIKSTFGGDTYIVLYTRA